MSLHPIAADHKQVRSYNKKFADVDRALDGVLDRITRAQAEYERDLSAWRGRYLAAVEAGTDYEFVEPEPSPPRLGRGGVNPVEHLEHKRAGLEAQRRGTLARLQPELEEALLQREAELYGEARAIAVRLRELADEEEQVRSTVHTLRVAAGLPEPLGHVVRPAALLDAAEAGASLALGGLPAAELSAGGR